MSITSWPPCARLAQSDVADYDHLADGECLVVQAIPGMQWQAGAGAWRLVSGCSAVDSLPDITLQLGGFDFVLSPRQYIIVVRTSFGRIIFESILRRICCSTPLFKLCRRMAHLHCSITCLSLEGRWHTFQWAPHRPVGSHPMSLRTRIRLCPPV